MVWFKSLILNLVTLIILFSPAMGWSLTILPEEEAIFNFDISGVFTDNQWANGFILPFVFWEYGASAPGTVNLDFFDELDSLVSTSYDYVFSNAANVNFMQLDLIGGLAFAPFDDPLFYLKVRAPETASVFLERIDLTLLDKNNQVVSIDARQIAPVPEPSTFLLLGVGLAGLCFVARRRKKG